MINQVVRYIRERYKWIVAGKPRRSPERIAAIYDSICVPCEHFNKNECNICGCSIKREPDENFNKLDWATTKCPDDPPRWLEEDSV